MPTCICRNVVPNEEQLAVTLRQIGHEGGHLPVCPCFPPIVSGRSLCAGCGQLIDRGCELHYDQKMPSGIGVVRFYTHIDCAKEGKTQAAAKLYFPFIMTRSM